MPGVHGVWQGAFTQGVLFIIVLHNGWSFTTIIFWYISQENCSCHEGSKLVIFVCLCGAASDSVTSFITKDFREEKIFFFRTYDHQILVLTLKVQCHTVDCTCVWTCVYSCACCVYPIHEGGVYRTTLAGQSMYCTLQYPGTWSVFVNGPRNEHLQRIQWLQQPRIPRHGWFNC